MTYYVLFELCEHLGDVVVVGEADHDVELLELDVDGVVVLDEEDLHLVLQDLAPDTIRCTIIAVNMVVRVLINIQGFCSWS